jgi:imidazolonepropionase-like amidohydrolase
MRAVFDKTKKLVVHTEDAKSMMDLVSLLEKYRVDIVIQGGTEAYKITDFLKERNIPVILHDIHQLPGNDGADIDQPFKTPALLEKKGIKFAFSLSNQGSWNVRNLPFQAGQAVAKGLDPEAAIRALTLSPAEILGIDKQVGSLEIGKEATFIVSEGDVLDMRTSVITRAYIQGQPISLEDKQKILYEKYMEKYQLND